MPEIKPGTPLYLLTEPLRQALSEALAKIPSTSWKVEIGSEDTPAAEDGGRLSFALSASGGLKGNAAFQLSQGDVLTLAKKLLAEDSATELNAKHKQAVEDCLHNASETAAVALKPHFGEVTLKLEPVNEVAWRGATAMLLASDGTAPALQIRVQFDSELLASAQPPATQTADAVSPAAPAKPYSTGDSNLDLLLGVDLNLTLRFGQRTLTLREILDLSSGSIIELDRQVQEPADLLLGDKLIARGEVVIVDGNYGLRITEVSDAQSGADRIGMVTGR